MILTLTEFEAARFSQSTLPLKAGETLWQSYGSLFQIEFPSPKTAASWQLTSLGWVGWLPLTPDLTFQLLPRLPLSNLFRMWAVAFEQSQAHWLPELVQVKSLPDFYDFLAAKFAQGVLRRLQQGIARDYLPRRQTLGVVRGRLIPQPATVDQSQPLCKFDDFTADIPHNQILLHTLTVVLQNPLCQPATRRLLRRAQRTLRGMVSERAFAPRDLTTLTYTRLTADYRLLHALCRFFLAHQAPGYEAGSQQTPAFLLHMPTLFEQFVAAWLAAHLPRPYRLVAQENVTVGDHGELRFAVDMVLYDGAGEATTVLDTKYKQVHKPDNADVSQIVTYAKAKQCKRAVLVYPQKLERPFAVQLDDLTIEALPFSLSEDLDQAGKKLTNRLINP